ncbi:vWA domain-containing protein [Botrimarina mediterranea]|uniref:von Willebrand factor type A domain protein n=1 Tax=Botrimarina mediterranea TaxID=2528022 RepID=A0A518KB43_9BACT|nr:VWA domain-containing protein [Botrimarina mediterranea]QDV74998.1 von Willebrand factor type A domain protein [Botrimarina mediterranea]QDV79645.1 von Willebrand factor type A domain protein [Planctomycetes bacterium K2D]
MRPPLVYRRRSRRPQPRRRGAILVLVAVLMPVFVLMAAFAIDLAWMQLVRTELRTATDSASRAGAKTLSLRQSEALARTAAVQAAARNTVAGTPLTVDPADVTFGQSTQANPNARFAFSVGGSPVNAVRVQGLRTASSADGGVNLFFGSMLGSEEFEPRLTATSTVLDRDIAIVIDRSGSMGLDISIPYDANGQNCGPMGSRTRFAALNSAIGVFLNELELTIPNEQVALVSYSSSFNTRCDRGRLRYDTANTDRALTFNYNRITSSMDDFMTNGIGGGTAIGEGLREGISALEDARPYAIKTIILMTDGRHNTGVSPESMVPSARAAGITIHTVTFSPAADINRMRAIANSAGGRSFHADTSGDLSSAFRDIARTLPVLVTD